MTNTPSIETVSENMGELLERLEWVVKLLEREARPEMAAAVRASVAALRELRQMRGEHTSALAAVERDRDFWHKQAIDYPEKLAVAEDECDSLRARVVELERDAARWNELTSHREITYRDDNGLWVATWKRASGDVLGIVRAHLDAALSNEKRSDPEEGV